MPGKSPKPSKTADMDLDTLLFNGTLVTMNDGTGIIEKGWIGIRDGVIQAVEAMKPDLPLPGARYSLDATGGLVMPGLVNVHTHLPMTLFRGLADDLPLMTWLNDHMFPAEARFVQPETVQWATRLACAEMLLSGTTCCCDGYFLEDEAANAVADTGLRAVLAQGVIDFPAPGVPDPKRNVSHAMDYADKWLKHNPLITPSIFCHAPYTCSDNTLKAAKAAADERGVPFQVHVAETRFEREQSISEKGVSPVTHLDRLGILDSNTVMSHCVWVDEKEVEIMADRGCTVAHCPESNMKLGSGVAPIPAMRKKGIVVGLGTDGCASNNDLDIFGEMDTAAKLHKVAALDPTTLDAASVLTMASLDGARAIGLGEQIGSLEVGKQADIIVLDTRTPHLTPLYHPESHIVYAATGNDVRHVFVAGKQVVKNRELLTMNVEEVMDRVNGIAKEIKSFTLKKKESAMDIQSIIKASIGDAPADLLLTDAAIINVFSGRIVNGTIAVKDGFIIGFGDYEAKETVDLKGRYVAPGFIDSHVHIESSMVCITEFARTVATCGTTTVVADPHEIANVLGTGGIDYMLRSAEGQPMDCLFALPSCVPATHMETAGADLDAADLLPFFSHPRVVALAEMMNYPGVIFTDKGVMAKIEMARNLRYPMDGHAPGVSGRQLYAYAAAGIASDHECTTPEEALEKLELGVRIMVREGTCARNLDALFPVIDANTWPRMMWSTDDRHPHDLLQEGHVDAIIRKAVAKGLDPVTAIRMGTLTPADYFGIKDAGAIAPGRKANLVVFSDLSNIRAEQVFFMGKRVAENGQLLPEIERPTPVSVPPSMNLDPSQLDFTIPASGSRARVIRVIPDQVVTRCEIMDVSAENGNVTADTDKDMLKIAVVERYTGQGQTGLGLVAGLGLKKGAIASSVAHDSHNIIVAGVSDADLKAAVDIVVTMGGGFAAVNDGRKLATLPLPVAGLMSDQPMETVQEQMDRMLETAKDLGTTLSDPFMTLGFLALPVIPDLKLTDKGLVDVTRFEVVPLFV